jgi:hypothetical protein
MASLDDVYRQRGNSRNCRAASNVNCDTCLA